MKTIMALTLIVMNAFGFTIAQELKPIALNEPDKTRGLAFMKALDVRASVRDWSDKTLSLQDLSDVLWAGNGVNRPDEGKRTASSAMNAQDINIYVLMEEGAYVYDAFNQVLNPVQAGDYRGLAGSTPAPVTLILVSDISRFRAGDDVLKLGWAGIDCGIVSQNISVFCAAAGLATRPRASFPGMEELRKVLQLTDSQHVLLNHPVGYKVEE